MSDFLKSKLRRGVEVLVGLALSTVVTGCVSTVRIEAIKYSLAEREPPGGGVFDLYGGEAREEGRYGKFVEIEITSSKDLHRLAQRKKVDHMGYDLHPCSWTTPGRGILYFGNVFPLSAATPLDESREHTYRLFVTLEYDEMRRSTKWFGAQDAERVLDDARKHGVCVRLAGGNMLGSEITSNLLRIAVSLEGNDLILARDAATEPERTLEPE